MVKRLKFYYHVMVLVMFLTAGIWQLLNMAEMPPENRYVADIFEYSGRYFTCWNVVTQMSYFAWATFEDIYGYKSHISHFSRYKTYFFYTFVIPFAASVFTVYWSIFHYDRELVYPEEADFYCMKYTNHIVHTAIIIFPILEFYFINKHAEVSFRSCLVGQTVAHLMYYVIFFYHYFTLGRFLYPVFSILTWYQSAALLSVEYIFALLAAKIGITIPKYVGKLKPGRLTSWKDIKCS